jgi:hypothetical protein
MKKKIVWLYFSIFLLGCLLTVACISTKGTTSSEISQKKEESVFEWDGTTEISIASHFFYDDQPDGGSSEILNGEGNEGRLILEGVVTTKLQWGFIGGGMDFSKEGMQLMKVAKGVRFTVKGDNKKYRVRLPVRKVKDYNFHGHIFTAPETETEVQIFFKDLKQEDWEAKVQFDRNEVYQISFQTAGQPHDHVYLEVWGLHIIPEDE